jgi:hypothetical protein
MKQNAPTLRMECLRLAATLPSVKDAYDLVNATWILERFIQGAQNIDELEGRTEIATAP